MHVAIGAKSILTWTQKNSGIVHSVKTTGCMAD